MNSQTNIKAFVSEMAQIPSNLIEELVPPLPQGLSQIKKGIIMVFARWSPFPSLCLKKMRGVASDLLILADAKLYIIDNDKLTPQDMERLFGKKLSGGSETFAVVEGHIRSQLTGCPEDYVLLLRKLFDELRE